MGRPEGWGPLGTPRRKWEDNIEMDLQKVDEGHGLIDLAQDRDRWWALVCGNEHSGSIKCGEFLD